MPIFIPQWMMIQSSMKEITSMQEEDEGNFASGTSIAVF
jgi:hypothetical protein